MKKPLWAIQSFAVHDSDTKGMVEAIHSLGLSHTVLQIPPFNYDNIAPVDYDGPVIPYGGTTFIETIMNDEGWFCVFNDNFKYSVAIDKLGDRMFNSDGQILKMKDFSPSMFNGEHFFIRPDKDTKEFAGTVMKAEEFTTWFKQIEHSGWDISEETEVVVAPASRIDEEWRMYVVDNKVVDGSKYRVNHKLTVEHDIPDSVFDYVQECIDIWQPAPFFAMDICRVNDELNILEIGDFHSCGWYASDKVKIIKAISDYVYETGSKEAK